MASLDLYQCLLHVKVASIENKAPVWLRQTFCFLSSLSFNSCALPCNFSNQTLSFILFFILSLIFWLIFILFQITCENQNFLQFHPHSMYFLHLFVFYLVFDFLVNISFIWITYESWNLFQFRPHLIFFNLCYLVAVLLIDIYITWDHFYNVIFFMFCFL